MALYNIDSSNYGACKYICDTVDDLAKITDATPGDIACVTSPDYAEYMLGSDGTWTEIVQNSDTSDKYLAYTSGDCIGITSDREIYVLGNSITNDKIKQGSLEGGCFAEGAITTIQILDGTITKNDLAPGVIPTNLSQLKNDITITAELEEESVTELTIAPRAVTSDKIADKAVTSEKIADGAVTNDHMGDDCVGTYQIVDGAVTAAKIANGVIPADVSDLTDTDGVIPADLSDLTDTEGVISGLIARIEALERQLQGTD